MKMIVAIAAAVVSVLASCSDEHASTVRNKLVTASSLTLPKRPYTPKPKIVVREEGDDRWLWKPEEESTKVLSFDQLIRKLNVIKTRRPNPLIFFRLARQDDSAKLLKSKSLIADALGCSTSYPCIEGTPEQLP